MDEVNKLGKILIVDDNEDVLFALNLLLEPYTEKIKVATTPDRIEHFMTTFQPDLILLDMNFSRDAISGQEGFESLKQILQIDPQAIVIFMTAYADTDKAVRAIKAGATDFIPKPWEKEKLLATLTSGMRLRQSQREVNILKEQVEALSGQSSPEGDIIGESPIMQEVFATINKLSSTDANILILGENGTGKDVIARLLYRYSPRYGKPLLPSTWEVSPNNFSKVNCSALKREHSPMQKSQKPDGWKLPPMVLCSLMKSVIFRFPCNRSCSLRSKNGRSAV